LRSVTEVAGEMIHSAGFFEVVDYDVNADIGAFPAEAVDQVGWHLGRSILLFPCVSRNRNWNWTASKREEGIAIQERTLGRALGRDIIPARAIDN